MMYRTLAIIKPDVVFREKQGKLLSVIIKEGFDIVRLRKEHLTREKVEVFYSEHVEKPFFEELAGFMTSGPCYLMVLEKEIAVESWRNLIGDTNPCNAAANTIRAVFGESIGKNAVHGSDSEETAEKEIDFFFKEA